MASAPVTRQGSCLCGAVKYTLSGEPNEVFACHCINCRKNSGAACIVLADFASSNHTWTTGADAIAAFADHDTVSGVPLIRKFCKQCGSTLTCETERAPGKIEVAIGTLSEDVDWKVTREGFAQDKRHWFSQ